MLRFTIFGVPVQVHPFFWITLVLIGGVGDSASSAAIFNIVLFVLAGFLSIMVHELGHALTARKFGAYSEITLEAFGGYAAYSGVRMSQGQSLAVTAAGPGAGFALFGALVCALCLRFNPADVLNYTSWVLIQTPLAFSSIELLQFFQNKPFVENLLSNLLWINFWWGILNLLPILPLDGGRITELFIRPQSRVFAIGLIAATLMAVIGYLWLHSMYTAVLFGYLAWRNYQGMQAARW